MTSHRLVLILAGAFAVVAIALAMLLRHVTNVPAGMVMAAMLGTYALGLGLGGLAFSRRG